MIFLKKHIPTSLIFVLLATCVMPAKAVTTPEQRLLESAYHGDLEIEKTRELLKDTKYINTRDTTGKTPFLLAAYMGHLKTTNALLQYKKTDVNAQDNRGRTALMWAAYWGHIQVVKSLLRHGIDLTLTDNAKQTALTIAQEREEVTKFSKLADTYRCIAHLIQEKDTQLIQEEDTQSLSWYEYISDLIKQLC